MRALLPGLLFFHSLLSANIISDVRGAITRGDFAAGESQIQAYRKTNGVTPEMLEALSWLGRGALAAKSLDKAHAYAAETRKLALEQLKNRPLDTERHLPIALGASIEVQSHVMAGRGERSAAIAFLQEELEKWRATSIRTRIQKNIHLLSLESRPAPPLDVRQWLGTRPAPLDQLKGRAVLLFFWAHWCGDCKRQAPDLAKLYANYAGKGLVLIGPTQLYGYASGGQDVSPDQETRYIDEVRRQNYAALPDMPVALSQENFQTYGASTTPTLVLIDRSGLVRMYHPGTMPYDGLAARVAQVLGP